MQADKRHAAARLIVAIGEIFIREKKFMKTNRAAGVLCHISSLPGKYGIGSMGKEAYRFARLLAKNRVRYWQILPLVQTGFGDSPYQSVSCDSGNPYFIDLEQLYRKKLITAKELKEARRPGGSVDYGALYETRYPLLRKAFSRFSLDNEEFRAFVKSGKAEEYALFMTAKTVFGGSFCDWEEPIKRHEPEAVEQLRTKYHEEYLFWQFLQFCFRRQWRRLKEYCNSLNIKIIGDIPLYAAYDSADVWAHPALFQLDENLKPCKVAGVPPDYFSEDGQLWGNPVYDWAAQEKEGFSWWKNRLKSALETYDIVRIDHFRGIDRYYEIPAAAETAREGEWVKGPGEKLFALVEKGQIIAEDLGIIDDGVRALLKRTGFPGMKVLLFAFDGDEENTFLPHRIEENSVVYTGTHDNDTVAGYVKSLSSEEFILFRSRVAAEMEQCGLSLRLNEKPRRFARAFVQMALCSKARLAVIPIQDVLGLGNSCRMNLPGTGERNWKFRLLRQPGSRAMRALKKDIKNFRR